MTDVPGVGHVDDEVLDAGIRLGACSCDDVARRHPSRSQIHLVEGGDLDLRDVTADGVAVLAQRAYPPTDLVRLQDEEVAGVGVLGD